MEKTINQYYDNTIVIVVLSLCALGIVMVYSASIVLAQENFNSGTYYFYRQIFYLLIGLLCMIVFANIDYRVYIKYHLMLFIISILLLILVLIPGIGSHVSGARRWIRFLGIGIQPSDISKLIVVMVMSHTLNKNHIYLQDLKKGFLPHVIIISIVGGLIILEPDLGSVVTLFIVAYILMFVAGIRLRHLFGSILVFLPVLYVLIFNVSYRQRRILAFLNPWKDPLDSGFQIVQSFLAIGSGGLFGKGLANSVQKLFFLPEPHTDFIFAIIAEELGFIGVTIIICLYVVLFIKGIKTFLNCTEQYGALLALGITLMISIQTIVNLGVVTGLLPTKGITLPFISFGGSSLIINLISIGILLNINRQCK